MKLTYPDGTIVEANWRPEDFTGIIEYKDKGKEYYVKGGLHRDGGLPAYEGASGYTEYWVNCRITGKLYPWA